MAQNKGLAPGVQARFTPDAFTQAIEQHGLDYQWSRALECSCRMNSETGQFDATCARCLDGWLYVNPCHAIERELSRRYSPIKAIFSSVTLNPSTGTYVPSNWTTGKATITVDGHIPVTYRDRFVGIEQRMTYTQVLLRDANDVIKVGWLGRTRDEKRAAMRYEPIVVHYIEDEDGVIYYRGLDFKMLERTLTEPMRMSWISGRGPAAGKLYSTNYDCRPVWLVDDASFAIQNSVGPAGGLSGANVEQYLPTTFAVVLDWLTEMRGS